MRAFGLGLLVAVLAFGAACRHKAAYSDVEVKTSSEEKPIEASGEGSAATSAAPAPTATQQDATTAGAETPQAAPAQTPIKVPWFVDTVNGEVKDLPNYPGSRKRNVSYGPLQGQDTMSLVLESGDPMEKIAAFYDRTVKANKWTVVDRTVDPDLSEWILKKGVNGDAKVQVNKDATRPGILFIVIARVERPNEAAPAPSK
jgi:hypothetical protein